MKDTDTFKAALIFSLGIHAVALFPFTVWVHGIKQPPKINHPPKMSYFSVSSKSQINPAKFRWPAASKVPSAPQRPVNENRAQPKKSTAFKDDLRQSVQKISSAKAEEKIAPEIDPDIIEIGEKISKWKETKEDDLPEHMKTAYRSYYQNIRGAIGRSIKKNYRQHFQDGDITISFAVNRKGRLLGARIIGSRGVDNYLKNLALKSLKDAEPLPAFPKKLKMDQMLFNITIHFRKK